MTVQNEKLIEKARAEAEATKNSYYTNAPLLFRLADALEATVTPTDGEREALATYLCDIAGGNRRTEVEKEVWRERADEAFRICGFRRSEVPEQGEPSDALPLWERPEAIEAARLAYQGAYEADYDAEDCIAFALRAAGEVR